MILKIADATLWRTGSGLKPRNWDKSSHAALETPGNCPAWKSETCVS
jgi:hypothetical protein